jgi:hypothetical protein
MTCGGLIGIMVDSEEDIKSLDMSEVNASNTEFATPTPPAAS